MDLRKLKTLIDLVSESGVAELEITEGEDRVRIVNRNGAAPVQVHQPVTVAQPMPVPVPAPEAAPAPAPAAPAARPADGPVIAAPLVGTYYATPAPDQPPFVAVGDTVKKGQTVCLIEAMKMMSEVPAPCDCVIEEVLKASGELVAFEEPLFRYRAV